jgi:hypothetical protein
MPAASGEAPSSIRFRALKRIEEGAHVGRDSGVDRVDRRHAARRGHLLGAQPISILQDVELDRRDDVPFRRKAFAKGRYFE